MSSDKPTRDYTNDTHDVLVELRVVIDGETIISRKLVERRSWDILWRKGTYLSTLAASFAHNVTAELKVRNGD